VYICLFSHVKIGSMKIINCRVRWYKDYANSPTFEVLVDKIPEPDNFIFEEKNGLYVAEYEGIYKFFYYKRPGNGFGGCHFNIKMKNGTDKILKGPWSSRASCVNQQEFGPCSEVTLIVGKSYYGGYAFSLPLLEKCAEMCGCCLIKEVFDRKRSIELDSHQGRTNWGSYYCSINEKHKDGVEFSFHPSLSPVKLMKEK